MKVYCDACAEEHSWPQLKTRVRKKCGVCKEVTICNIPASEELLTALRILLKE